MSNSEVRYPMVELDLKKFRNNIDQAVERCGKLGIGLAGVIKGFTGIPEGAKQFADAGCDFIASSRLEQIQGCMDYLLCGYEKMGVLARSSLNHSPHCGNG